MKYSNGTWWPSLLGACLFALFSTAHAQPAATAAAGNALPKHFFMPSGAFKPTGSAAPGVASPTQHALSRKFKAPPPLTQIALYASPTTRTYLGFGGLDATAAVRTWENFFRKYRIPYQTVVGVDVLEAMGPGVLVLPSQVALSEREMAAIAGFRARGGSVLATWLNGVRGPGGEWLGFSFMERALDARVVGDTANDGDVNYIMTHGDGPITYNMPAGQRVWLDRVEGVYPLRMVGDQSAASVMDWGRSILLDRALDVIVFSEKLQPSTNVSRSVVLGYAEQQWLSTDPAATEAVAYNALLWLLRQPSVHLAAWPYPFTNAVSFSVEAAEKVDQVDIKFSKQIEKIGARATYYLLTQKAAASAEGLRTLLAQGHDLGYLGDDFEGFRGQAEDKQRTRLLAMQQQLKSAGLAVGTDRGFAAPMDSLDKTTAALVNELGLGHFLSLSDLSEARLPVLVPRAAGEASKEPSLVLLPRTMGNPEALIDADPADGLRQFLKELDVSLAMGGLSLLRFPNQSLLTEDDWKSIFDRLKESAPRGWFALNGQIAQWWRERSQVVVGMDVSSGTPKLTVTINTKAPLTYPPAVVVSVPIPYSGVILVPDGHAHALTTTTALDPWRVAVSLKGLPPGTYQWSMAFDLPTRSN
jgi:hypothetical protein